MIKKTIRDEIASQALNEIRFAREEKKQIIARWHKNEDLYYQKKLDTDSRANVNLNEAQAFVDSFLSKINKPLNWKYIKGEEADFKAAEIANAIKEKDSNLGNWNYKVLLSRKQLVMYGRYIFEYHASSENGYSSYLTPVDVYQFLIDPACGGLDIEKAFFLGRGVS